MVYIAQQSFGFGEIDPNLRAQYESQQYQRGCRTLSNALLSDTGSARKRWGSVFHTDSPGDYKAFEFINGWGDRFLVLGSDDQYSIERNGTILAKYEDATTDGNIKDIATTGDELIVLVDGGIYRHLFTKSSDTGYFVQRVLLDDINANLLTSLPPVTFSTTEGSSDVVITTNLDWWSDLDVEDPTSYQVPNGTTTYLTNAVLEKPFKSNNLWKISQPGDPDSVDVPRFMYPNEYSSKTVLNSSSWYRYAMHLIEGYTISINQIKFATGLIGVSGRSPCRINLNGDTSLIIRTSGGERTIEDQDIVWLERIGSNGNAEIFTQETGGSNCLVNETTQSSQVSFDFLLDSGEDTNERADPFRNDTPPFSVAAGATHDWIGPYKYWVNIGKALTTLSPGVTGLIDGAAWSTNALSASGTKLTLSDVSGDFESDHSRGLSQGQVGRFLHYINGVVWKETYFYVYDKSFHADPGAAGTPRIILIQGNDMTASSVNTDVGEQVLVLQLATSYEPSATATVAKTTDGKPSGKNGWKPQLLTRIEESNGEETVQRVGIVGSPDDPTAAGTPSATNITSYIPTFTPGTALAATSTFTNTVYHTRTVGDSNPIKDSQVFRVGEDEVDAAKNYASTSAGGIGPSAYWKLTGKALNPKAPGSITPSVLIRPERITYHQGRIFIGGLNSDISGSNLRHLPSSQLLGLTVIASQSGSTTNFDPGSSLANDGLSFIVLSKKGGMIRWMLSKFNILFLGSEEEEFVIADAPMTPTAINISMQSEYGGGEGAYAVSFGSAILFVQADGKTIRSMGFQERRNRYESRDLLQFAKHITKNDTIKRIEVVGTATQVLFALTTAGKLYCLTINEGNAVFGWNEWSNSEYTTISDIVGTSDASGNPALWANTSASNAVLITSDDTRDNYHVDGSVDGTSITATGCTVSTTFNDKLVSVILTLSNGDVVYIGDITVSSGSLSFGHDFGVDVPTKVVIGYSYTMTLAPNIPELMVPGKGSTLGRGKNVSRLRVLFNQARGAKAAGYDVLPVPLDPTYVIIPEASGFYSVPVVGEYGSQPVINITQSAPYGFEVSGYNAEYDFGD